jgi:hypothetical protein
VRGALSNERPYRDGGEILLQVRCCGDVARCGAGAANSSWPKKARRRAQPTYKIHIDGDWTIEDLYIFAELSNKTYVERVGEA